jgi:hypothetical protein
MNKTLRSYTQRFFEMHDTITSITNEDVIRCFQNRLFSKHRYPTSDAIARLLPWSYMT